MAGGLLDPNLSYGWTNQQPGASSGNLYGQAGLGYGSVAGVAPTAVFGTPAAQGGGLALAGTGPYIGMGPYGVVGNANAQSLTNSGYADQYPLFLGQLTTTTQPPLPTWTNNTRVVNPTGLAAQVTITSGTASAVYVGPAGVGGTGTTNLTEVGTAAGTFTVPPAGVIYVTGSTVVWTWITTN